MNLKTLVIAISVVMIVYIIGMYFIIKESKQCDTHVILIDNEEYDCTRVNSYNSGVSSIALCNGKIVIVPTNRIKKVIQIN